MPGPSFKTNPVQLSELLKRCADGRMQLPEFQRSWVWDDERIRSLIASISRSFPIGALMTLGTGGNLRLKARLERATGQAAYRGAGTDEPEEDAPEDEDEAELLDAAE
jgi:hypothetical protein